MGNQSSNNSQNRNNRNRSGGGNKGNSNNNRNRNRNNNNNRNRNRNNNNRSRRRRKPEPKPTAWQKFLSAITFGRFGKSGKKKKPQRHNKDSSRGGSKPEPQKKPHQRRPRPEITEARLYVGNLAYDANEDDLESLFNGAGTVVSAEVVTNSRTQQSKGFAFVEMGSLAEAKRAVDILDDRDFMGRRLRINSAKSQGPRDSEEGGSNSPKSEEAPAAKEEAPKEEEAAPGVEESLETEAEAAPVTESDAVPEEKEETTASE